MKRKKESNESILKVSIKKADHKIWKSVDKNKSGEYDEGVKINSDIKANLLKSRDAKPRV